MKHCTRCKQEKALSEFRKSTRGPLHSWCRECEREYQKLLYKNDPTRSIERSRNWRKKYAAKYSLVRREQRKKYYATELARKHKLTKAEVMRLLETQGASCKACGVVFDITKPLLRRNLDHCHKTGRVRGFLCSRCNTVAGFVNDDPSILHKISEYLTRCITS